MRETYPIDVDVLGVEVTLTPQYDRPLSVVGLVSGLVLCVASGFAAVYGTAIQRVCVTPAALFGVLVIVIVVAALAGIDY